MSSPKEIAEMIIKKDLALDNVHSDYIILARAYLELVDEYHGLDETYEAVKRMRDANESEITKLKEENELLWGVVQEAEEYVGIGRKYLCADHPLVKSLVKLERFKK